ncbi:MAG TPA: cyclodeaminase/cyclohydrolase family protein [Polyangiales bacterium]|jgi:formiminotetrahydrofolate cyclodeaminase|nr:cyclodeaminase/cyclohydrolase family protein [Polyangiales bacterium]
MSDSIWNLSLRAALDQTASANPTPGGGSIAPLSGAFGLGLVLMALEVSAKKNAPAAASALEEGRAHLAEIAHFVDRDVAVFQSYMAALRLPKATEAEQVVRDNARGVASLDAARTPLLAAEACLRALHFAKASTPHIHKNVWSDLQAGADLLMGAIKAVLRTVDINLPALKDAATRQAIAERAVVLEHEAMQTYTRIVGAEPSSDC